MNKREERKHMKNAVSKFERAFINGTGARFTKEETYAIVSALTEGAWDKEMGKAVAEATRNAVVQ